MQKMAQHLDWNAPNSNQHLRLHGDGETSVRDGPALAGHSTSLGTFRQFLRPLSDNSTLLGAAGIFTLECLHKWLENRTSAQACESEVDGFARFRRAIMAHLSGSDGRKPFDAIEEQSILLYIRGKRNPWTAFSHLIVGKRPYTCRTRGFHESEGRTSRGGRRKISSSEAFSDMRGNEADLTRSNKLPCYSTDDFDYFDTVSDSTDEQDSLDEKDVWNARKTYILAQLPPPLPLTFGPTNLFDHDDLQMLTNLVVVRSPAH